MQVALVKPGKIPIQVVLNEASKRKSPSNVGLNGDELHVGDTAMNLAMKKPHFTFPHVKPLMGRMYNPEYLQKFGTFYHSFEIVKHEERGVFGLKCVALAPSSTSQCSCASAPQVRAWC